MHPKDLISQKLYYLLKLDVYALDKKNNRPLEVICSSE